MAAPSPALPAMAPISAPPAAPAPAPVMVRWAVGLRSAQAERARAAARMPAVARRYVTILPPRSAAGGAAGGRRRGRAGISRRGPAHQPVHRQLAAVLRFGLRPGEEG